jgi:hypothetical protein
MEKEFFQQYGLPSWIFYSHKNSQCALFAPTVLFIIVATFFADCGVIFTTGS